MNNNESVLNEIIAAFKSFPCRNCDAPSSRIANLAPHKTGCNDQLNCVNLKNRKHVRGIPIDNLSFWSSSRRKTLRSAWFQRWQKRPVFKWDILATHCR